MPPLAVAPKTTASGAVPDVELAEPETDRAGLRLGLKALAETGAMISKVRVEKKSAFDKLNATRFDLLRLLRTDRAVERGTSENLIRFNEGPFDCCERPCDQLGGQWHSSSICASEALKVPVHTRRSLCSCFRQPWRLAAKATTVVTRCLLGKL